MNIIWLFWPKGQHLTLFPVRHLSFGCQGCPASIGLTHSEPLMLTHWGTWAPSSLSFFILFPWYLILNARIYYFDMIQPILTRGTWNFSIPTTNCLCVLRKGVGRSLSWADFLARQLRDQELSYEVKSHLDRVTQGNASGLPTSLLSETHF